MFLAVLVVCVIASVVIKKKKLCVDGSILASAELQSKP